MWSVRTKFVVRLGAASALLGVTLACSGSESTGPSTGNLQVSASTTGAADLDPDGYVVAVDGGTGLPLGINGSVNLNVKAGTRTVALGGVAANCAVMSPNPATVTMTAGDSVRTAFQVSCALLAIRPIAFSSNRNVSTNIYAMNADGSGVVQLTYGTPDYHLRDASPAWSPDGTKIAFWSTRDGDYWEVWAINADGTGLTRLTSSPRLFFDPAPIVWSPDGGRMAAVFADEIYVLDADGSSLVNVTNSPAADGGPTWSPDGNKIAFWTNRDGNSEIYVMNADGSNPVNLTTDPATDNFPAWSPDGTKIAFTTDRDANGIFAIYVVNADGSGAATRLISPADDQAPVWSPDGRRIAFIAGGDIYVMSADGSSSLNVTNNPPFAPSGGVAWSPDGLTIAFDKSEASGFLGIWVVNVDGSGLRPIAPSGNSGNLSPAWRPR